MKYSEGDCRACPPPTEETRRGRWAYLGRSFTKADNPKLTCTIRILPSGTVYYDSERGARRLDSLKTRGGIVISLPDETQALITWSGNVFVGDEIKNMKKEEPGKVET